MKPIQCQTHLLTAVLLVICWGTAWAEESDGSTSTTTRPNGVVGKVEHALAVAATATAHGIQRGASATAHGVKRGVEAAARGIERGAEATDRAVHKVASKITGSQSSSDNSADKK